MTESLEKTDNPALTEQVAAPDAEEWQDQSGEALLWPFSRPPRR
jgi:hypothetical protein